MKQQIDLKSAMVGLLCGIAAMLAIGAASSPGTVGRYQIGCTANQGLVVDTATGQVWTRYFSFAEGYSDTNFFAPKNATQK